MILALNIPVLLFHRGEISKKRLDAPFTFVFWTPVSLEYLLAGLRYSIEDRHCIMIIFSLSIYPLSFSVL